MQTTLIVLAGLAYVVTGIVLVVLHGRKKLAPHVSDMFDMLLFVEPGLSVFLAVLAWPVPVILGAVAGMFTLKTSLKPGDGKTDESSPQTDKR